jgi:hypothetical protein
MNAVADDFTFSSFRFSARDCFAYGTTHAGEAYAEQR